MKIKPSILYFDISPWYKLIVKEKTVELWSCKYKTVSKQLKGTISNQGYLHTSIQGKVIPLHKLVSLYCLGERPEGLQVNHIDGNKLNNHPSNLEYVTQQYNLQHAIELGLHVASDSSRMPTYIDGRCKNIVKYKSDWYYRNREKILQKRSDRYNLKKEELKQYAKDYYRRKKNER